MKLMTKELEREFEKYPLYSQDNKGKNAIVVAKFFNPRGCGTWLITEGNKEPNGDYTLFGWCDLGDRAFAEFGYVMLSDLEDIGFIERHLYFPKDTTIEKAKEMLYGKESE